MRNPLIIPPSHRAARLRQSGSAVLAALGVLAVTLIAVGSALFEASHRFRTSYHSARWSQAGQASEAGADIAMMTAQKDSWIADGWSAAPGAPGTPPVTNTITLASGDPAMGTVSAVISVDKITMGASDWLRIRSTGVANVAGGARAGIDTRDVMLRKLSLRTDRSTGAAVTTPEATRTVEILAQPVAKSPFVRALLLDKKIKMSGSGYIDSFDSSDPAKSTGGVWDLAKRQSNGDVGVNDTQGSSDLNHQYIYGNLAYSGGAINDDDNVQGTTTTPFSSPVTPVLAPVWTTFNATPTSISGTATLTGGPQSSPSRYKVTSLSLSGSNVLTLSPHAVGQESYVEIWVTGNFTTSGSAYILEETGIHATFHVEGDVTISGSSFDNQNNVAANNVINAITPTSGTRKVDISGSGTLIAAVNAPGSDFKISGGASVSGALIGRTMDISGSGNIHYDEALAKFAGSGSAGVYRVASWVEAVR